MRVVGIGYQKRVGKDVAASWFMARGYERVAFADALKREVGTRLRRTLLAIHRTLNPQWGPTPPEQVIRYLLNTKPPIVRELLQEYGTEIRRHDAPDYWIQAWLDTARPLLKGGLNVVVPDVRFHNEAQFLSRQLPHVMRLHHGIEVYPFLLRLTRSHAHDPTEGHASEVEGGDIVWDAQIANDGTIEDLYCNLAALFPDVAAVMEGRT